MPFISSVRGNYSPFGKPRGGPTGWRPVVATGGTISDITVDGIDFRVHRFTSGTTNFIVSDAGTLGTVEALIVGGGGGGGFGHAGGAGGGAVLHRQNQSVSVTTYSIVVGNGASGNASNAENNAGGNSSAFGVTATGGGSGSNESGDDTSGRTGAGGAGANGGGGNYSSGAGGTGTAPTASGWNVYAGNNGGVGAAGDNPYGCGGGGGAGGVGIAGGTNTTGSTARGTSTGGWGGDGVAFDILGQNYFWGAGGGGVGYLNIGTSLAAGTGGAGGGGGGSPFGGVGTQIAGAGGVGGLNSGGAGTVANNGTGGAGGTNTGGGGGGGANENGPGGAGGSGFVAIRYPLEDPTGVWPYTTSAGLQAGKAVASMTGGTEWFAQSVPYWGVEDGSNYRIPAGKIINRFSFREGNSVNNTALWFVVFEKMASAGRFSMIAAWRFTQATAGNDSVLTVDASAATLTRGTRLDKSWICPHGATFGTGEYYIGWVSSDGRVGTKNGAIWVDSPEGSIPSPAGFVYYTTVSASGGLYPDELAIGYQPLFPTETASGYKVANGMHIAFLNV